MDFLLLPPATRSIPYTEMKHIPNTESDSEYKTIVTRTHRERERWSPLELALGDEGCGVSGVSEDAASNASDSWK